MLKIAEIPLTATQLCSHIERVETGSNPHSVSLYLRECADSSRAVTFEGQKGALVVTTVSRLMSHLLEKNRFNKAIPKSPAQFGKRLKKLVTRRFRILDEDSGLPELKRKNQQRLIGIFEPIYEHATAPKAAAPAQAQKPSPVVAAQPAKTQPKPVTPVQPIRDVRSLEAAVAKPAA